MPTCKPSRYTKQNLRLCTITTSKGFRIGPSSAEIGGGSNMPRTLKHPVVAQFHLDFKLPCLFSPSLAHILFLSPLDCHSVWHIYCRCDTFPSIIWPLPSFFPPLIDILRRLSSFYPRRTLHREGRKDLFDGNSADSGLSFITLLLRSALIDLLLWPRRYIELEISVGTKERE